MCEMCRHAKVRAQLIRTRNHFAHLFERRVSILFDQVTVRRRKLREVRRIDDQFPALFNDAAEFVTRLPADPKFVIVPIEQRDHAFVSPANVLDVNFAADCGSAAKRFVDVAGKQCVRAQAAGIALSLGVSPQK